MTALIPAIPLLRAELKAQQSALEHAFIQHQNTAKLLKSHCKVIDKLLKTAWQKANIHEACSLIAVGGYGRGELYPHSDIDLLILLPNEVIDSESANVESFIGALWDIGLHVGHSVRTLEECAQEAKKDVTVLTNMLESRLLCGQDKHYRQFADIIHSSLEPKNFYASKIKEQDQRHAKFNDSANNLEPNLKESPGGLRDLQMILWLSQSLNLGKNWSELAKNGVIRQDELVQIRRHERTLQQLRIRLHYMAKRREDRLLFDFQHELASQFGFINTPRKRASEALMQRYYRSAKYIGLINEIILKVLGERFQENTKEITINARFKAIGNRLETSSERLFSQHPEAILESFLLLQLHPEITEMGASLVRQLQSAKKLITHDFRENVVNKRLFLEILRQEYGVNHSMRRMNNYGILGAYLPVFGKIVGQMQHDLFHVYTVDEHILNVLANLRRFAKPELKHEFPLCTKLFESFEKPHLLYLAALFHDIAKGRGGDHSTLGTKDAKRFCKQHGLSPEDTSLVAWLVEAHLKMSSTAQKSDLSDPSVVAAFANFVQTELRLTALYLLTVADIRGTSPAVWNAWKARLLESLFYATKRALNDDHFNTQQTALVRQSEAALKLKKYGLSEPSYHALWQYMGEAYFTRYEPDEIAWQSRLLIPHVLTEKPIVRARLSPRGDGIQVMIYTKDQDDLFARICNFFDHMAYNIVEAKIYTTQHGFALNQFIVLNQQTKDISYSGLLKFIETELTPKLDRGSPIEMPLKGRVSRQVKFTPFASQVRILKSNQGVCHLLEIVAADRPGLLAQIAHIFLRNEVDLHNAKINTLGNRAEDSFLVSSKHIKPLNPSQIAELERELATL